MKGRRCSAISKRSTSRSDWNLSAFRLPVQWVNRRTIRAIQSCMIFGGLSGQIAGGIVKVGQKVMVLPSGWKSSVKGIWTYDGTLQEAFFVRSPSRSCFEHDSTSAAATRSSGWKPAGHER